MARTWGSSAASFIISSTEAENESYGWCTSTSWRSSTEKMLASSSAFHRGEGLGNERRPRRVVQLGTVEGVDGPQALESQRAGESVDVVAVEAELLGETLHRPLRGPRVDLEPDDGEEAAAAQLLLEGEEQIIGGVVVEGEVGVPGDPEDAGLADVHAREQFVDERHQGLLEGDEPLAAGEGQQPSDVGRHLDPGEPGGVIGAVADLDPDIEGQIGDVGERDGWGRR